MTRPGPGKFEGNESLEVSEYLHSITMNGMQDDEIGDVESIGWHALISGIGEELDIIDVITGDIPPQLADLKDAYIVTEDNNGFFSYVGFDSDVEARKTWQEITTDFLQNWLNKDEVSVI